MRNGQAVRTVVAGMILHLVNDRKIVTPHDAEAILNDGLLNRIKIKIKIVKTMA